MLSSHKRHDMAVRSIVEASLPLARRRVDADTASMSNAELQGYLRARVMTPVRNQARQLANAQQFDHVLADELAERATDRTVNLLLRELTEQPLFVIPMYEPRLRAAA